MKRVLKTVLFTLLILVGAVAVLAAAMLIRSKTYTVPEQAATIENDTGLVQASGRSLYDAQGNRLQLRGINAGQILLQEGWMSPFALEPLKNADSSYVKDGGDNIQYPEFTEMELRNALASNPNLAGYDVEELLSYYYSCFFAEEDFRIIREDLGLNVIRLPFFYLNILNEDLSRKEEEKAFSYLDWFVEQAGKHGLYVILDLHGAPGSQSGYEHAGSTKGEAGLWGSEANIAATVDLWDYVSEHYLNTRPDLGKYIASYDLLNEPTYTFKGTTTKQCWAVFDRIYDAIRANGDAHVITFCCCWDFAALPDPADYEWENVQYQYHWYNWRNDILPYDLFYAYQDLSNIGRDYDVPVLIGEFTAFEDRDAWNKMLSLYDSRGYNWTIWNYKTTVTGWWTSSWGVYTAQLKFITENEELKCNVSNCTYEEFIAACEKTRTENCATGTLYEVLKAYMGK